MSDNDFEIRLAALNAAVDLHETGEDASTVLATAEKFLPFLNGGVPVAPLVAEGVPPIGADEATADANAEPAAT